MRIYIQSCLVANRHDNKKRGGMSAKDDATPIVVKKFCDWLHETCLRVEEIIKYGLIALTMATWKIAVFCYLVWMNVQPVFWVLTCAICIIFVWSNAPVLHPNKARFGEVITRRQKLESVIRLLFGYVLVIVFWSIHRQNYAGILMMKFQQRRLHVLIHHGIIISLKNLET